MATFVTTYQTTGAAEDVKDLVEVVSPQDTPVYGLLNKGKCFATLHEWLNIALVTSSAANVIEGDSAGFASADWNKETRTFNYTHTVKERYSVSGTMNVIKKYGRSTELDFRRMLAMKQWKIDAEWNLLNSSASAAGTTAAAREMSGLEALANTTATANASSTLASPISQTLLDKTMQDLWNLGVTPNTLVCGGFAKRSLTALVGTDAARPILIQNGERVVISAVDVYEGDFGRLAIVPSRNVRQSRAYVLNKDLATVLFLREPFDKPIPPSGDEEKGMIIGEFTLEYLQTSALARIYRVQSA